jgi:hypothetical protein
MNLRLVFCLLGLTCILPVLSQTIETDRPDQTEAATLVPAGGIQLEAGVAGWTSGEGSTTGYTLPTTLLRYGMSERFELRAVGQRDQMQFNFIDMIEPWFTSTSWDVGAKVAGWNTDRSQMCVLAHYRIRPDAQDGGQVRVNVAKPLGERFSVGTNVGMAWTWATSSLEATGEVEYTLALGYSVSEALYTYIEAFGAGGGIQGDAGLAWRPNPLSQFDVSAGWTDGSGQSYVALGWSKLWMPAPQER